MKVNDIVRWCENEYTPGYPEVGAINLYEGVIQEITGLGTEQECYTVIGKNRVTGAMKRTFIYANDRTLEKISSV